MKKHEACYWIGVIASELKDLRVGEINDPKPTEVITDYATRAKRPATPEDIQEWERRRAEHLKDLENRLAALDVAGDALTGGPRK
jgi:hypothetical protein